MTLDVHTPTLNVEPPTGDSMGYTAVPDDTLVSGLQTLGVFLGGDAHARFGSHAKQVSVNSRQHLIGASRGGYHLSNESAHFVERPPLVQTALISEERK